MSKDGAVVVRPAPGALAPEHHHHHHHHHHHPHAHHQHHHSHAPRKLQTESLTFCGNCEKPGEGNARLLRCQACHNSVYCNAECQKAHWPIHKFDCKRLQGIYASMPPDVAERQKKLNAWMRQRISLFKRAGFSAVLFPPTTSSEDSAIAAADSETQKSTEATPESAEPSPATEEAKTDSESAGALAKVEAEISSEPAKPKPATIKTHFLAVTVTPFTSTTGALSFEIADADVGDWESVPELWVTANVRQQQADLIASAARRAAEDAEKSGTEQRDVRGVLWILIICDMVPHLHPIIVWEDEAEKDKARREAEGQQEEEDWEQKLKDGCKLGSGQPRSPVSEEAAATA